MWCFVHFDFEMCFAPQRRALFRHLNFQKWPECEVFFFHLQMCFAPQRRAVVHLSFGQLAPHPPLLLLSALPSLLRSLRRTSQLRKKLGIPVSDLGWPAVWTPVPVVFRSPLFRFECQRFSPTAKTFSGKFKACAITTWSCWGTSMRPLRNPHLRGPCSFLVGVISHLGMDWAAVGMPLLRESSIMWSINMIWYTLPLMNTGLITALSNLTWIINLSFPKGNKLFLATLICPKTPKTLMLGLSTLTISGKLSCKFGMNFTAPWTLMFLTIMRMPKFSSITGGIKFPFFSKIFCCTRLGLLRSLWEPHRFKNSGVRFRSEPVVSKQAYVMATPLMKCDVSENWPVSFANWNSDKTTVRISAKPILCHLWLKIRRSPFWRPGVTFEELEQRLAHQENSVKQDRLRAWRTRMRGSVTDLFRWLRVKEAPAI